MLSEQSHRRIGLIVATAGVLSIAVGLFFGYAFSKSTAVAPPEGLRVSYAKVVSLAYGDVPEAERTQDTPCAPVILDEYGPFVLHDLAAAPCPYYEGETLKLVFSTDITQEPRLAPPPVDQTPAALAALSVLAGVILFGFGFWKAADHIQTGGRQA